MDPRPATTEACLETCSVARWPSGSSRFGEIVAAELNTLQVALGAAFEREVDAAINRAVEAERTCRLAAEVDVNRLEIEVRSLRDQSTELRRSSAVVSTASGAALSQLQDGACLDAGGVEPVSEPDESEGPACAEEPACAAEQSEEDGEDELPCASSPVVVVVPSGADGGEEAPESSLPGGGEAWWRAPPAQAARPPALTPKAQAKPSPVKGGAAVASGAKAGTPTRIPKPMTRGQKKRGSLTLEDLDDQRLLKLTNRLASPSIPRFDNERSSTPQGSRARLRKSSDDSAAGGKRNDKRTRAMYDKRTLRRMHRDEFKSSISEWQAQHTVPGGRPRKSPACQVFVRMRPLFDKERKQGEFEAVTVTEEWGEVVVHHCLFHSDLVRMFVDHMGFCFPRAFGAEAEDVKVYGECGSPAVVHAISGQLSTLFMFGQTGSGKTYTMNALMELASRDIFDAIGERDAEHVTLKAFEIAGKKCVDLMSHQRTELRLLDNEDGRTNVVGAFEVPVASPEETVSAFREALVRRKTGSHGRNEESSRSHCVCVVELPAASGGGSLILVDCAGTERRQDTEQHSAERTRESAEINASLHALKECIRYRAKEQRQATRADERGEDPEKARQQVHVPYRGSYLTRVLHESFTKPGSFLAAFGTISPAAIDSEHTLSTLRTLQLLMGESGSADSPNFEQKVDIPSTPLPKSGARRPSNPNTGLDQKPPSLPSGSVGGASGSSSMDKFSPPMR